MVSTPPPGSWLAPWTSQIDLMVSADAVEVRNDLQGGPHPKAIENKKTEYVLSEILVPVCFSDDKNHHHHLVLDEHVESWTPTRPM